MSSQLPLGRSPWNHAQHNLWPGKGLDSWFLTPENDRQFHFKSARFAKPGQPYCRSLGHSDRAFNYMVTQCFPFTGLLCLSGLRMAGVFLMSSCSIFGFLLLSQYVVLQTLLKPGYEYRIIHFFISFSFCSAPCLIPLCFRNVILQESGEGRSGETKSKAKEAIPLT